MLADVANLQHIIPKEILLTFKNWKKEQKSLIYSVTKVLDTITEGIKVLRVLKALFSSNDFIFDKLGLITSSQREITSCLFSAGQFLLKVRKLI